MFPGKHINKAPKPPTLARVGVGGGVAMASSDTWFWHLCLRVGWAKLTNRRKPPTVHCTGNYMSCTLDIGEFNTSLIVKADIIT